MAKTFLDPDKKPNVIWVIADQMRAQAMGFMGDENLAKPKQSEPVWLGYDTKP